MQTCTHQKRVVLIHFATQSVWDQCAFRSTSGPGMSVFQEYLTQMHYSILQPNVSQILFVFPIFNHMLCHLCHCCSFTHIPNDVKCWPLRSERFFHPRKLCSKAGLLCKKIVHLHNWGFPKCVHSMHTVNKRLRFCNSLAIFAKKRSHILKRQCHFSPEVCLRHRN